MFIKQGSTGSYQKGDYAVLQKTLLVMVLALLLAPSMLAIHTPETRYSVEQTTIEQRNIYFTENRYGQGYVRPFGGFGRKGASQGSFGKEGAEEAASNLPYNTYIKRGRNPGTISNYYQSARGYRIINTYVKLSPTDIELITRPQINSTPQGHARIISNRPHDVGLTTATVVLRTKDLPPLRPDYIYESWLVDEDTGTSMSLGIFQPDAIGRVATLNYKSVTPLDPFESIIVTIEPFPDENPGPSQVILAGEIKEKVVRSY